MDDIPSNPINLRSPSIKSFEITEDFSKFELFYQPIVEMTNYQVQSVEALIRWTDHKHEAQSPDQFIHLTETNGKISQLTYWTMLTCFAQLKAWLQSNRTMAININISEFGIHDHQFMDKTAKLIQECQINPSLIHLEITEQTIVNMGVHALAFLSELKKLGVVLVLDEFHFKSLSLQDLMQLPFDEIKIGKLVVDDIAKDASTRRLVKSIIDMAHNFDKLVGAVGIETADTWHYLNQNACDNGQGFFLCKPLPVQEFNNWLGICC